MRFYPRDIGTVAGNLLEVLKSENIGNVDDMKKKVGRTLSLDYKDSVTFDERHHASPMSIGISYVVSYLRETSGIPIEFSVNDIAGYALVIVKAQEVLPGYSQMAPGLVPLDPFENICQDKENRCAGFDWVKRELETLYLSSGK
ncbi:hypothetical protein CMI42_05505 [Candidatus Pacearchaeota archaeon]|nr:hypothetical protein [Candidatus Pacearchaeota archaeon]|tara:strand:- start:863 stop:1294 length:432 start_codon:yes stop_codon:yes gene_type:complete